MRKGRFHAVYLIDDDLLELSARCIHHRAERQTRQLGEKLPAYGLQNAEGRPVGNAERAVIKHRADEKPGKRRYDPRRICRKCILSRKQQHNYLRCGEIRSHTACSADDRKNDRGDQLAVLFFSQFPDSPYWALFFHKPLPPMN